MLDSTEFSGAIASSTFGGGFEATNVIDGYKQVAGDGNALIWRPLIAQGEFSWLQVCLM